MSKSIRTVRLTLAATFMAGIQISVLVAIVASQIGERAIRGAQGFALYRDSVADRG